MFLILPQTITYLKFVDVSVEIRRVRSNMFMPSLTFPEIENAFEIEVRKSPFFKIQVSLPNLKCLEVEAQEHSLSDVAAASLCGKYLLEGNKFTVFDFEHKELNETSEPGRLSTLWCRISYLSLQLERETLIKRLQHIYLNR